MHPFVGVHHAVLGNLTTLMCHYSDESGDEPLLLVSVAGPLLQGRCWVLSVFNDCFVYEGVRLEVGRRAPAGPLAELPERKKEANLTIATSRRGRSRLCGQAELRAAPRPIKGR